MSPSTAESLFLFIVAALARVAAPHASFFGPDQVGILVEARGVLEGHLLPPGPGIGWTPFKLGPLFEWVAAVGLLPRDDFADVVVFIGLVHALAVLGWRRLLGEVAGPEHSREVRLAGWALALHPLSVSSGSGPVSTAIVLPTTLLFVWGNVLWVRRRSPVGFALACVGAAMVIQAHITATLLLPLIAVGFRRRAPIGRIGLLGLVAGMLIAAPMVVRNLLAFRLDAVQHAGSSGAPFVVALLRAATIEARVLEISGDLPFTVRAAGLLWSVFILAGAIRLLRRPAEIMTRSLFFFCWVVPTLVVASIPLGALFLYFDSTVPVRAWLFSIGVCALAALPGKGLVSKARSVAIPLAAAVALVVPAAAGLARRIAIANLGYLPVNLSRADLRDPLERPSESVGVLTLGSHEALGRVFDELGADPEQFHEALHGPWRWAGAMTLGFWIEESRRRRTLSPAPSGNQPDKAPGSPSPGRAGFGSFLLLHREDHCPTPATNPAIMGPFRAYSFENRFSATSTDNQRITGAVAPGSAELQAVTETMNGLERAISPQGNLNPTPDRSPAGFIVWSAPVDAAGGTVATLDFAPRELRVLQVRAPADVYAFARETRPPTRD